MKLIETEATARCMALSKVILKCNGIPFRELEYWVYSDSMHNITMMRLQRPFGQPSHRVVCSTECISDSGKIRFRNAIIRCAKQHGAFDSLTEKPLRYKLSVRIFAIDAPVALGCVSCFFSRYSSRVIFHSPALPPNVLREIYFRVHSNLVYPLPLRSVYN